MSDFCEIEDDDDDGSKAMDDPGMAAKPTKSTQKMCHFAVRSPSHPEHPGSLLGASFVVWKIRKLNYYM